MKKPTQAVIDQVAEAIGLRREGDHYVRVRAKNEGLQRTVGNPLRKASSKPASKSTAKAVPVKRVSVR